MNEPLNVRRRVQVGAAPRPLPAAACNRHSRALHPSQPARRRLTIPSPFMAQEEQIITDRLINIKEKAHAMRACEWHNSKMRNDVHLRQLQSTKAITAELEQQNKELLLLRRARMKEFLADEAKEWAALRDPHPPIRHSARQWGRSRFLPRSPASPRCVSPSSTSVRPASRRFEHQLNKMGLAFCKER